ncbi:MAG: hypothetical protein RIS94_2530 [Pseudomonadota bacterium]|jgi:hypothetical protein
MKPAYQNIGEYRQYLAFIFSSRAGLSKEMAEIRIWHAPCNTLGISGRNRPDNRSSQGLTTMTSFRQFSQPLFAGLSALALSLTLMAATVSTNPAGTAAPALEYLA